MTPDECEVWLDEWLDDLRHGQGKAASTIRSYERAVRRFAGDVPDLDAVTALVVNRHFRGLASAGMASATMGVEVAAVRSFFGYLTAMGVIRGNPAATLKAPRVYRSEPAVLTKPEVRRLIYRELPADFIGARDQMIVSVGFCCGLRVSEVGGIHISDFSNDDGASILLRRAKAAGGDVRVYLCDDVVLTNLAVYLRALEDIHSDVPWLFPSRLGGGLSVRCVYDAVMRHFDRIGIRKRSRAISPHTLRHTLATLLYRAGTDLIDVQAIMRHESLDTTRRYVRGRARPSARAWRRHHPLRADPPTVLTLMQTQIEGLLGP